MYRKITYHFTKDDLIHLFGEQPIMDGNGWISFGRFSIQTDEEWDPTVAKITEYLKTHYNLEGDFKLDFISDSGLMHSAGFDTRCDIELETTEEN